MFTERMRITSSGNVGIGTTNPMAKLEINNAAFFTSEYSITGTEINWLNGNKQTKTLTANTTFTFSAPANKAGNFILKLIQDSTGSRIVTWPSSVKWPGGTAPSLSAAPGAIDIVAFYYDGASYYGVVSFNFK